MAMTTDNLEEARSRIERLDASIIKLAAERVQAAREAGRAKQRLGLPTVDFQREGDVLRRVRAAAKANGLLESVAEDLLLPLMAASVSSQENDRVLAASAGKGQSAVVVGGAGRMGRWLVRFLQDAGFTIAILDPASPAESKAGQAALATADLILVATPPSVVSALYSAWAAAPPRGVVADVCSVKAPLAAAIRQLQDAGASVGSFHPMFGPSLANLRNSDVVLCRTGDARAEAAIRALFAPTSARLVELALDAHDRAMAESLALAHAAAIAYAAARSGPTPVHSTTQRHLAEVADGVVRESPQVYFEIQTSNPHAAAAVQRLQLSLQRLCDAVQAKDGDAFARLLADGRNAMERLP